MKGRSGEVVETISRRGIDLCCIQETRWGGGSARMIVGKNHTLEISGSVTLMDSDSNWGWKESLA